jgi:DNA mismatch endonuclease (patch repair protein)
MPSQQSSMRRWPPDKVADIVDSQTRSRMMSGIRSRNTKPELALRAALRRRGLLGYRIHWRGATGRPDIAFPGRRLAIFVDGAFWHGHPDYFTFGKSGAFWDEKIRQNMRRDREVDARLLEAGWRSIRVWDFEVLQDADAVATRLAPLIEAASPSGSPYSSGSSELPAARSQAT